MIEVSWKILEDVVQVLSNRIPIDKYTGIYGVPRGGMIPAVMLSHIFDMPIHREPQNGDLIVDDIADNGHTAIYWKRLGFDIAVVYRRIDNAKKPIVDYYGQLAEDWVLFPWEKSNSDTVSNVSLDIKTGESIYKEASHANY